MDEKTLVEQLANYSFYHTIPLTEKVSTPGSPIHEKSQLPVLAAISRLNFKGKRVLDVGCRDGLYSFKAEQLGAADVIAIDNDLSQGSVDVVIPFLRSKVQMHSMNMMDLTPESFGKFDIILFAGVLYHLRYPFYALKLLRDVMNPGGRMVLETAIFYSAINHAMLYCPVGSESPYEATSCTFYNKKGLIDTLQSLGWKVTSVSLLHPEAERRSDLGTDPIIDRAVFECEFTGVDSNSQLELYWHGEHSIHARFGGDSKKVSSSGLLSSSSV
jgi:2-polyprenyl-3-methyl-5-hydroxy-6-metoxy-1,4-benzoquinol methylase